MGQSRSESLKRVAGLALNIEEHLEKLKSRPAHPAANHWKHEIRNWIHQLQMALPDLGRKTSRKWAERVEEWDGQIGS